MLDKVMVVSDEGLLKSIKVGSTEALAEPMRFEVVSQGSAMLVSCITA